MPMSSICSAFYSAQKALFVKLNHLIPLTSQYRRPSRHDLPCFTDEETAALRDLPKPVWQGPDSNLRRAASKVNECSFHWPSSYLKNGSLGPRHRETAAFHDVTGHCLALWSKSLKCSGLESAILTNTEVRKENLEDPLQLDQLLSYCWRRSEPESVQG